MWGGWTWKEISCTYKYTFHTYRHFRATNLNCLCLDGGRKLENPDRTHTATQTLKCWSFGLFLAAAQLEVQTRTVIPPKTTEFYYKSSTWGEAKLDKVTTKTKYYLLFEVKIIRRMFTDKLSCSIPVLHTEKSWFDSVCVCVCALMRTPVSVCVSVCGDFMGTFDWPEWHEIRRYSNDSGCFSTDDERGNKHLRR